METNRSSLNREQEAERAENNLSQPADPAALEDPEGVNETAAGDQNSRITRRPQTDQL